jgi:predicted RNase H-like nuclease (RuvC/YqgF family)
MEPKNLKIFDNKIMQSVSAFCSSNNIEDIDDFIYRCFKQGFDISKYGLLGKTLNDGEKDLKTSGIEEKHVIKEVIVEKRVEVPVEVIKEVEKIVTKIEYICDKSGESELFGKIKQLTENIFHLNEELESEKKIFSTKTEEMENIFHYEMSKKESELDELRRNLDIKLDENKLKMMGETLQKLKKELSLKDKKIEELESINKQLENVKVNQNATYLNGSNITRRL